MNDFTECTKPIPKVRFFRGDNALCINDCLNELMDGWLTDWVGTPSKSANGSFCNVTIFVASD